MLGVWNDVRSRGTSFAIVKRATGTGTDIATGAVGPGADEWPMWQTWHFASSAEFLWKCAAASVASVTMDKTIAMASRRWSVLRESQFSGSLSNLSINDGLATHILAPLPRPWAIFHFGTLLNSYASS
jgi:hypothetical protein